MANEKNLEKGINTRFKAGEEQARIARKAGIASGVAKRQKGEARRLMLEVLTLKPKLDAKQRKSLETLGYDPNREYTVEAIIQAKVALLAMAGDTKAVDQYLQIIGEDFRSLLEERRLTLEKEAVEAVRNTDGFMDALKGMTGEVFTDGGDTPDAVEDK